MSSSTSSGHRRSQPPPSRGSTGRRPDDGGGPSAHPLLRLLFGSLPIGTWFNIRVRIHASLLWYVGLTLLFSGRAWHDVLIASAILFVTVLLHEFGHALTCRWVGGTANDIVLWILGGLATCRPPRRPLPTFLTVAGGPAVHLLICIVTGAILFGLVVFGLATKLSYLI